MALNFGVRSLSPFLEFSSPFVYPIMKHWLANAAPGRRTSSRKESLRGQRSFLDSSSMSQKLQWMDLQMRVPEYLEDLRGLSRQAQNKIESFLQLPQIGQRRRSTLVLNEEGGEGYRSSSANRRSSRSVSRSSFTRPLVSTTATEERKRQGREVEDKRLRQGSVVEVPVDPKHWLLQSLRLQDRELQELFDQVHHSFHTRFSVNKFSIVYYESAMCRWKTCQR